MESATAHAVPATGTSTPAWYSSQWWVPVRVDSYADEDMSHSEWCDEQYGDYYDPRTNTYEASDGRSYRCIRPRGD